MAKKIGYHMWMAPNEIFENLKVTRLLGMISGMPKLPKTDKDWKFLKM